MSKRGNSMNEEQADELIEILRDILKVFNTLSMKP